MKKSLSILVLMLSFSVFLSCGSPDTDAVALYDQMTAVVEKYDSLAKAGKFVQSDYRGEIAPLEKELSGLNFAPEENASFMARSRAAERYQKAVLELSSALGQ